ncbi:arginine--tRNA ligase [Sinimarinibacterium sp. CAU 1509]|uniref:arginine--tRNA ligase n=1 Tax=Sinimarinibacterium sp. CAU 1509 TaxID=2562283 RepID=UPI0010AC8D3E|nr:arginine--tRNA ligase [Sinimarinibacterium sp. CAU 1509]TJY55172.1 arginine--tRNA ligase [Sinimarinibacterium sp. CAU 1509]
MKEHLQELLASALKRVLAESGVEHTATIQLDATKDTKFGDFQSNLALQLAKTLGKPPRGVAEALVKQLPDSTRVSKVEIAGPGFINFFLASAAFQGVVAEIIEQGEDYGCDRSGNRGRIMVEFVSANPTGPMHVGHGRGAAYGDSISKLLAATGWQVWREYYVNDAGRQVDILTLSVWVRYLELCGENVPMPQRAYPSEYIRKTAQVLHSEHGDGLRFPAATVLDDVPEEPLPGPTDTEAEKAVIKTGQERFMDALIVRARSLLGDERYDLIKQAALDDQLAAIRKTLADFNVSFDQWSSERELVDSGFVSKALTRLEQQNLTYEKDGALWMRTEQFGDEKDRVLIKADGAATYFCNDLAYHIDKLDRGYDTLMDVWGADHHGYIARVRAAIEALTERKDALNVQLIQFVTLSSGRMGKRSGNFVTLQDLIDEAGTDATRFFYLTRSHDQHLEFDIDLARSQTNDNPVFYVQYAHARICRVFEQLVEKGGDWDPATAKLTLHRLTNEHEKALLTLLNRYPDMLQRAASAYTPHTVVFFLKDLAEALHAYYNMHRFLVEDDPELQAARLALVAATGTVIRAGLKILGVSAPEKM